MVKARELLRGLGGGEIGFKLESSIQIAILSRGA